MIVYHQIALFQRRQKESVISHFKHKSVELEKRLKDVTDQCYRLFSHEHYCSYILFVWLPPLVSLFLNLPCVLSADKCQS